MGGGMGDEHNPPTGEILKTETDDNHNPKRKTSPNPREDDLQPGSEFDSQYSERRKKIDGQREYKISQRKPNSPN